MAIIGSKPRLHRVITDKDFQQSAAKGLSTGFTTLVKHGTYPRSGMDHPNLAIGDRLEFILSKKGLRLLGIQPAFEVKAIGLQRDRDSDQWVWAIEFKKLELKQ